MNSASLISQIQQARDIDPALSDILIALVAEQERVSLVIDPAPIVSKKIATTRGPIPPDVSALTSRTTSDNLILEWSAPSFEVLLYEIRIGSSWATATRILTTATLQAILDPIAVGTTTYLIKAINSSGNYSETAASAVVIIGALGSITVNTSQLGNFVLVSWAEPSSTFRIDHYIIKKNTTEVARIKGTFYSYQENAGGTFTYGITAYDVFGNASAEGSNTAIVAAPSDFVLKHEFESVFTGTKVNAKIDGSSLLVCLNLTETYQAHFTSRAWTTIQAQIDAGYSRWLSPDNTTASYKEVFDIGSILTNTIVNLSYLYTLISGSFTTGFSTRVSDDNITYGAANTNMAFFAPSVRYIEVTVNFTGGTDKSLLSFYHFHVAVSVKEEVESGEVSALASDVNGTVVTFIKAFKDVDSITLTVKSTAEQFDAIYKFTDVPNPPNFAVFVYDSGGIRSSQTVSYKIRGII